MSGDMEMKRLDMPIAVCGGRLVGCGKAGKGKGREGETHSGGDAPLFILDCCIVIDTWKTRECTHS